MKRFLVVMAWVAMVSLQGYSVFAAPVQAGPVQEVQGVQSASANRGDNLESKDFLVEGAIAGGTAAMVSMTVYGPADSREEAVGMPPVYQNQTVSAEKNGVETFSFAFRIPDGSESGWFYIRLGSSLQDVDYWAEPAGYVTQADHIAALAELNACTTAEEIAGLLTAKQLELGFLDNDLYAADGSDPAKLHAEALAERIARVLDDGKQLEPETAGTVFRQQCILAALNENDDVKRIHNIFDYADELPLSEILTRNGRDWTQEDCVVDAVQTAITERISGKGFMDSEILPQQTNSGFPQGLIQALVLSVVENPDGVANVRNVVCDFAAECGIENAGSLSDAAFRAVIGQTFETVSDLSRALKDADEEEPSGGNNGSSGGGGGHRGSGSGTSIQLPNTGISIPDAIEEPVSEGFTDLDEAAWAKEAILSLQDQGIVQGKTDTWFDVNGLVTRAELTKMTVGVFGVADAQQDMPFTDVSPDMWYFDAVQRAYAAGLVHGVSDTVFNGDGAITRQDMAALIYRALQMDGTVIPEGETEAYRDQDKIAEYAGAAVNALKQLGIMEGYPDGTFCPEQHCTRAEAAKVLYMVQALIQK